jgi:hypothetical protein
MPHFMRDKATAYLAAVKIAEGRAATEADARVKASFASIGRVYRKMAEKAPRLAEDETPQR